jgi:hypothetical protein
VYAAKSADRYAFINMRKVKEGDITPKARGCWKSRAMAWC